jgi:hypothetical protein
MKTGTGAKAMYLFIMIFGVALAIGLRFWGGDMVVSWYSFGEPSRVPVAAAAARPVTDVWCLPCDAACAAASLRLCTRRVRLHKRPVPRYPGRVPRQLRARRLLPHHDAADEVHSAGAPRRVPHQAARRRGLHRALVPHSQPYVRLSAGRAPSPKGLARPHCAQRTFVVISSTVACASGGVGCAAAVTTPFPRRFLRRAGGTRRVSAP